MTRYQVEPYEWEDVIDWLLARGGRWIGHRGTVVEVAPGRPVRVSHGHCPTVGAKRVAAATGLSYAELRAEMGHPIVNGRRGAQPARQATGFTKRDVVRRLSDVRRGLVAVEAGVGRGIRDAAFYRDVHERLAAALHEIEKATERVAR